MNHETKPAPEGRRSEADHASKPPLYEAAGNRFYINVGPIDTHVPPMAAFRRHQGIDTVLNVAPLNEPGAFKYEVHERDGSMSEMCGNGARAVAAILTNTGVTPPNEPITLVTQNEHRVEVTQVTREDGDHYRVDMGHVSNIQEDSPSFEHLVTAPEQLGYTPEQIHHEAVRYMEDPKQLKELFPDESDLSNYDSYFLNRLQMVYGDEGEFADFDRFCQSIQYRGLYQAGGEPHMLLELTDSEMAENLSETKFNLFLKMNSFLIRNQRADVADGTAAQFPHSMNITFFKPNEGTSVDVYPAERGVHNGVKYDQTEACGTGSSCLGEYLMTKDPRYADVEEVEINTRNEHSLYIQRAEDHVYLIGTAQASETVDHQEPYSFTTEAILEKRRYFNPDGEEGMDKFFSTFQDTPLRISDVMHTQFSPYIFSTANHPNFLPPDMYAALGLYRQTELADALAKEVYTNSLDTTGTDVTGKKVYPIVSVSKGQKSLLEQTIAHVATEPPAEEVADPALVTAKTLFGDPMSATRDNSQYKPGKELAFDDPLQGNLRLSRFFTPEELARIKARYDELKPRLPKSMRTTQPDQLLSYLILQQPVDASIPSDSAHHRKDVMRHGFVTAAVADGIADYHERSATVQSGTPLKETNSVQSRIKNRLMQRFLQTSCSPAQRELLKRHGVLTENGLKDAVLYSEDTVRKDIMTTGFQTIIDDLGAEFLDDYFKHMSIAAGEKPRKVAEVLENDGSYTIVSAQHKDGQLVFRGRSDADDSAEMRARLYGALTDSSQLGAWFADADFLMATLGGMTQMGSERGGRDEVFNFLKTHPALSEMGDQIAELEERTKGIVCDTYDPREYGPEKVTPAFPVATDMSNPQEYITLLMMMGGRMSRFQFQELLHDDHREPRVASLSFPQRTKLLTGTRYDDPELFASSIESHVAR